MIASAYDEIQQNQGSLTEVSYDSGYVSRIIKLFQRTSQLYPSHPKPILEEATSYLNLGQPQIRRIDNELFRLEAIYHKSLNGLISNAKFIKLVEQIEWAQKEAAAWKQVINWCITLDAIHVARRLSAEGLERFPDDPYFQHRVDVLAPPRVLANDLPPNPRADLSLQWFSQHGDEYEGWVAILDGKLIANAPTYEQVLAAAGESASDRALMVARIP